MNFLNNLLRRYPVLVQILRFAAIGALNTALDFIILNFITKSFNISSGFELGLLNVLSFSAAVIQSYYWNKAWAFASGASVSVFQNFFRLVMVGGLGFVAFVTVFLGAAHDASNLFYLLILVGFVVIELILWKAFNLKLGSGSGASTQFASFIVVSIVGLIINSVIIVVAAQYITPYLEFSINADSIKNVAKVLATVVSLVWNFIGYKLIVFKK
ncbi:MAG TPA: GtrA family protein [Patescibacteria group bacterium]|jgi:putative flippase GtrA|nr:GtrA family protein [Patescibacteria group bacterium]